MWNTKIEFYQGRFTTKGGLSEADGSISPLSKRKHYVSAANNAIQETKENPSSPSLETFRFEDENNYKYKIWLEVFSRILKI